MKSIRRWTSGVVASFDWMVSQVENHEALVNSSIRDIGEAGARAKVQLKRVRQDGTRMRKKLATLREEEELWRERAIRSAELDEKRAIECVRRHKRLIDEISELEVQEVEHAKLEKQLTKDLSLIEDRMQKLKQQRNLLRTRQSRAEALSYSHGGDSAIFCELDEIFERWETKVTEYEIQSDFSCDSRDEFEDEFVSEEEEKELRLTLSQLLVEQEITDP